jgi:hypothetical protein
LQVQRKKNSHAQHFAYQYVRELDRASGEASGVARFLRLSFRKSEA